MEPVAHPKNGAHSSSTPYRPGVDLREGRSSSDLLVLAYAVASQLEVHVWQPGSGTVARALLLAGVLALLLRRRFPQAAALSCALGGAAAHAVLGADSGTGVAIVTAAMAAGVLGG